MDIYQLLTMLVSVLVIVLVIRALLFISIKTGLYPIKVISENLIKMATTDFTENISGKYLNRGDEIGTLKKSLSSMQEAIRDVIKNVITETLEVDKSITTTNKLTNQLNIERTAVSSTTEELSAAMEESAAAAEQSKKTANEIQNITKAVVSSVDNLKESSEQILEFVDKQVIKEYDSLLAVTLAHSKWNCKYHIVFAPKYRRRIIYGGVKEDIGMIKYNLMTKRSGKLE